MLATTWITRQLVFNGIVSGLVIGLLAMGIVLVYRSTKVLNFAVGNIGLIGATLLSVMVIRYHVPFWIAVLISLSVGAAFAVAVELTVIRRLFRAPRVTVLVATIGIAGLALAIASALPSLGSTSAGYPVVTTAIWSDVAGFQVSGAQLSIIVAVPITAVLLAWFLNRTTVGRTVHASADNPDLARVSGISPKRISTLVWAIAGLIGTMALILVAGQGLSGSELAQLGPDTLARALVAAVLAGLASIPRAMLAGVAIGIAESVIGFNFINQPGVVDFILFVAVLIAVWVQSRRNRPEPDIYPATPKGRAVPDYLRTIWWIRHMDKALIGLACVVALVVPFVITEPSKNLLYATILAFAISASSLTILVGWSGLLSLGQMAFAGLGALTAASLTLGMHVQLVVHGFEILRMVDSSVAFLVLHRDRNRPDGTAGRGGGPGLTSSSRDVAGGYHFRLGSCSAELSLHALHIRWRPVRQCLLHTGFSVRSQPVVSAVVLLRRPHRPGGRLGDALEAATHRRGTSNDRRSRQLRLRGKFHPLAGAHAGLGHSPWRGQSPD